MKKIVCTLIMAGVFLAGFLFCAIACKQEEMKAPYISLTGNVVSWSPIEGAECYQIYQDNQQVADTESNSYLLSIEKAGSYEIKVKAVFESGESEFSNTVLFVVEQKVLSAPLITLTENKVLWEKVENANRYAVYINENLAAETEELYYIIDVQEVGYYDIKVKALSDLSRFTDSPFSEEKEYAKTKELMSPEIFIEENVIRWGEIENADAYAVFVNGTQVLRTTELFYTFEGTEIGTFEITIKALSNNVLYLASKQSNSVSYTVNPIALQAPQLKLEEGILRWKNVANATQYEIYCDNEVVGRVVETEYIPDIMEAGTYVFSVKAISDSPKYLNSELSNEVNIVLSAPSTASAVLAGGRVFRRNIV